MEIEEIQSLMSTRFPNMEAALIKILSQEGEYFKLIKKKTLVEAGTLNKDVFILFEGMIRGYFINREGYEKNIFLRPKNTVTAAPECVFNNEKTKYAFEALNGSQYIRMNGEKFQELIETNPSMNSLWTSTLQETLMTLIWRVESFVDRTPEQRYEELLKRHPSFFQNAYNKHIANYLGMTSVSESLREKLQRNN